MFPTPSPCLESAWTGLSPHLTSRSCRFARVGPLSLAIQEMLQAVGDPAPEAGRPLDPSQRAMSFAAVAVTYWAGGHAVSLVRAFARREGVAVWALVAGGVAYVALSTCFVYFVYVRRCLSGPRRVTGVTVAGATAGAPASCDTAGEGKREGRAKKGDAKREKGKESGTTREKEDGDVTSRLLGPDREK